MNPKQLMQEEKQLVLIADDDLAVRQSLQFSLELEGFLVRTFSDGNELLNEREFPKYGCLIIDYKLPPTNGTDVLGKLRRLGLSIPAILLSSYSTSALRATAASFGVPIIEKPLLGNFLIDAVRNAFAPQLQGRVV